MSEPEQGRPGLLKDLEKARRYGSYILLFASLPSVTLPGLVAKLLHLDELISLWHLSAATAPLTAAVALIGIASLSGRIEPAWLIPIAAFSLLGSLFLGLMLGDSLPVGDIKDFRLPEFIFAVLAAYYRHYGFWSFATTILVGGLLAWMWSRLLWPRVASLGRGAADPERDPRDEGAGQGQLGC